MKKRKIELSKKLLLNKETITGLSPAQQQEVEGGRPVKGGDSEYFCASGSGCDCQKNTCGIIICQVADEIKVEAI